MATLTFARMRDLLFLMGWRVFRATSLVCLPTVPGQSLLERWENAHRGRFEGFVARREADGCEFRAPTLEALVEKVLTHVVNEDERVVVEVLDDESVETPAVDDSTAAARRAFLPDEGLVDADARKREIEAAVEAHEDEEEFDFAVRYQDPDESEPAQHRFTEEQGED